MLIIEPKQWPGQLVPYWECLDDTDQEPYDWTDW